MLSSDILASERKSAKRSLDGLEEMQNFKSTATKIVGKLTTTSSSSASREPPPKKLKDEKGGKEQRADQLRELVMNCDKRIESYSAQIAATKDPAERTQLLSLREEEKAGKKEYQAELEKLESELKELVNGML